MLAIVLTLEPVFAVPLPASELLPLLPVVPVLRLVFFVQAVAVKVALTAFFLLAKAFPALSFPLLVQVTPNCDD